MSHIENLNTIPAFQNARVDREQMLAWIEERGLVFGARNKHYEVHMASPVRVWGTLELGQQLNAVWHFGNECFLKNAKFISGFIKLGNNVTIDGAEVEGWMHPKYGHVCTSQDPDIRYTELGDNVYLREKVTIRTGAKLGDKVWVGPNAYVCEDATIKAGTRIPPSCHVPNEQGIYACMVLHEVFEFNGLQNSLTAVLCDRGLIFFNPAMPGHQTTKRWNSGFTYDQVHHMLTKVNAHPAQFTALAMCQQWADAVNNKHGLLLHNGFGRSVQKPYVR